MADLPAFAQHYKASDPALIEVVEKLRALVYAPGALEAKTKLLIAMALDAQANHPGGVASLARRARAAGASEQEIIEALRVVYEMAGMQMLSAQHTAFPE